MKHLVCKIVSGGQTGVDRAALDVAIYYDIEHGGWCPKGRRSEDGIIPPEYKLRETDSRDYALRTEQNVIHSDGTLIIYIDTISKGTDLTRRLAKRHRRPLLLIDLVDDSIESIVEKSAIVKAWLVEKNIGVLNVAGPRASSQPGIEELAHSFLINVFDKTK